MQAQEKERERQRQRERKRGEGAVEKGIELEKLRSNGIFQLK